MIRLFTLQLNKETRNIRVLRPTLKRDLGPFAKFEPLQGIPTHDASGEEIAKAQVKKLQKMYAAQEKKHSEYVKSKSNEQ